MTTFLILLLCTPAQKPLELESAECRPGLVADYRAASKEQLVRLEPKPAFFLGDSTPHPRLPPGPFTVTWTGTLTVKDATPITFSALVGGELEVRLGNVVVLSGTGTEAKLEITAKPITLKFGTYPFTATFRSTTATPRVQLWWAGTAFAKEVIPAWRFGHTETQRPNTLATEETRDHGRRDVQTLGCARCHAGAFPSVTAAPPGPDLTATRQHMRKEWLFQHLAEPTANMPVLFAKDRVGAAERWLLAEYLTAKPTPPTNEPVGDHRRGRIAFIGVGCAACHVVPDMPLRDQKALGQKPFTHLAERMSLADVVRHLLNPHVRYPDGRMPQIPLTPGEARDIATYITMWSPARPLPEVNVPADDVATVIKNMAARDATDAAMKLLTAKGCVNCHTGVGDTATRNVPITDANGGCVAGSKSVRYTLSKERQAALQAYLRVAKEERHPSPFAARQTQLTHAGCVRCHQRDTIQPPAIEEIGSTLGGAHLQELPFLRTPRLTNPHQKFTRSYLRTTLQDGTTGLRGTRFSYRMPHFGDHGADLLQALAEADGEDPAVPDTPEPLPRDPTVGTLHGAALVGFQGYACASCHVWNTRLLASPDPGATGPDLTRTVGRIRRDWFERYLEAPIRFYPNTPMPTIFPHGQRAVLTTVLDGDATKQKEALWAYLAKGKDAPTPTPPPALPIRAEGNDVLVAQIPLRVENKPLETISLLTQEHELLVYELNADQPLRLFTGAQILRNVQGRIRQFSASGTPVDLGLFANTKVPARTFLGYETLGDGVILRWTIDGKEHPEMLRFVRVKDTRQLQREWLGQRTTFPLPARVDPAPWNGKPVVFADDPEGTLVRPGYKATPLPRPKTISGEDRVMPGAIAVRPKDGQVFVASMKTGELFTLPTNGAAWQRTNGLYQDALSMLADDDGLYVLHRRNLTRLSERRGRWYAERIAALPHGIADTYDMAYGLARDREGRFIFGYAPYANTTLPGSGGAVRLTPGKPVEELAYGMRNPLGWCRGPEGAIFYSDNQGEWVATNKLGHIAPGTFQGFPNAAQRHHTTKPRGQPTVWVPYAWARSINGIAYDETGGKFGPFAGQIFMAELMFGGAIIRANVEQVNGVYQGACFPFWGKGLLGPVTLAFDPKGPLYVGGITEPGWMAMPDRGAVYRLEYTGEVPFEMQAITVRPDGLRITFTQPIDLRTATVAGLTVEHYRYEYTGSYGSPELDRQQAKVTGVTVSKDGRHVDVMMKLIRERVYLLSATGVRSATGAMLVHPQGAYTLNEIPK